MWFPGISLQQLNAYSDISYCLWIISCQRSVWLVYYEFCMNNASNTCNIIKIWINIFFLLGKKYLELLCSYSSKKLLILILSSETLAKSLFSIIQTYFKKYLDGYQGVNWKAKSTRSYLYGWYSSPVLLVSARRCGRWRCRRWRCLVRAVHWADSVRWRTLSSPRCTAPF